MKNLNGQSIVILLSDTTTLEVETFEIPGNHLEYFLKQLKRNHRLENKEIEMIMDHGIRLKIADSFSRFSMKYEDQKGVMNCLVANDPEPSLVFELGDNQKFRMAIEKV
jgi:hypothetical protein